jgi:hypothetical protein
MAARITADIVAVGQLRLAVFDEVGLGCGAPHIKSDDVVISEGLAYHRGRDKTADRA